MAYQSRVRGLFAAEVEKSFEAADGTVDEERSDCRRSHGLRLGGLVQLY